MCGAYGFLGVSGFQKSINLALRYNLLNNPKPRDSYNIRPTMEALVISRNSPNKGSYLKFGIEAPWKEGMLLINAKSETVGELRTYKKMFMEDRCLIPASFFFEWKINDKDTKTPFLFRLKSKDPFSFAGIHNNAGFVILTVKPNDLVSDVHNRMPVILKKELEDVWLNPESTESDLTDCMTAYPEDEMETYAVGNYVSSASNQGEEVIKPVEQRSIF